MAENYRFFDSQIGDVREYNASEFAEYFETLIDTGLIVGALNELNPTVTGANMIVTVDTGNAFINGRWYENDSSLNNTFDTETIPNDRIDLLVLRLDLNTNERKITFEIVKGTPSVTPVAPTLTRTSVIYELGLAEVAITGGQSFIDFGDLNDLREITTDDSFSFPTASSKVVTPQTATNTSNIATNTSDITDLQNDKLNISSDVYIKLEQSLIPLAQLQDANFGFAYEGISESSTSVSIGLPNSFWNIKFFRHIDNNGFGTQMAVAFDTPEDIYFRSSNGLVFNSWIRLLNQNDIGGSYVTGTYTGDGSASRFINLGFTPSAVILNDSLGAMFDEDSINDRNYNGGLAVTGGDLTFSGNGILDVTTNGFNVYINNVDSDNFIRTNFTGTDYRYIAFR